MKDIENIFSQISKERMKRQRWGVSLLIDRYEAAEVSIHPSLAQIELLQKMERTWRIYYLVVVGLAWLIPALLCISLFVTRGGILNDDPRLWCMLFIVQLACYSIIFGIQKLENAIGCWRLTFTFDKFFLPQINLKYSSRIRFFPDFEKDFFQRKRLR